MQGIISKCLAFSFLLTCIYGNTLTEDTFLSGPTNINGTEGKTITIPYVLNTNIKKRENYKVTWLKDGQIVDKNDGHIRTNEDNRKFSLTIYPLQRSDEGKYKLKLGELISQETVLNIIEIPSSKYPRLELEKLNDQLNVYCISENTSPHPKFSINEEELRFYENPTYIWVNKTVLITDDMPKESYTCVLELRDYYKLFAIITGIEITTYLRNITYGSTCPIEKTESPVMNFPFKFLLLVFVLLLVFKMLAI
ncbi:uncharacterized protein LOC117107723 [Anneissia japonica]|uniref:uncharacterized protein LOC117107723 n=1 Tax=Anneissia japonica TaxID=1529436 RepID=UPI00142575F7|nr:uncharacterized protein LOC117107723 [Anneissia japonica]